MNIEMKVTERGFEPNIVRARVGEETKLRIQRTIARTCATSIQSDGGIAPTPLPLGQTVKLTVTPQRAGTFRFGCAMGMHIGGTLIVDGTEISGR